MIGRLVGGLSPRRVENASDGRILQRVRRIRRFPGVGGRGRGSRMRVGQVGGAGAGGSGGAGGGGAEGVDRGCGGVLLSPSPAAASPLEGR